MKNSPLLLLLPGLFLLGGCVAPPASSIPAGYTGPRAVIRDSSLVLGGSHVDFFVVTKVDGKEIMNSVAETRGANYGKGFNMTPVLLDREVPAGSPVKLELLARSTYAAPILELTNAVYQVKGEITFTPVEKHTYLLKGVLGPDYSAVWVEDTATLTVADKKIEVKGSAKLGFWGK